MAKKIFRKCICCGKQYEYCNHCGKNQEPWKNLYDSRECKEIMNIVSAYNVGRVDAEKVKEVLDKYHVTDYANYTEDVSKTLLELFAKKSTPIVEKAIAEESINEKPYRNTYNNKKKPWKKNYNADVDTYKEEASE